MAAAAPTRSERQVARIFIRSRICFIVCETTGKRFGVLTPHLLRCARSRRRVVTVLLRDEALHSKPTAGWRFYEPSPRISRPGILRGDDQRLIAPVPSSADKAVTAIEFARSPRPADSSSRLLSVSMRTNSGGCCWRSLRGITEPCRFSAWSKFFARDRFAYSPKCPLALAMLPNERAPSAGAAVGPRKRAPYDALRRFGVSALRASSLTTANRVSPAFRSLRSLQGG